MDYQNKKKYKRKKAKEKTKAARALQKREETQAENRAEKQRGNMLHEFRERIDPYRKPVKEIMEE